MIACLCKFLQVVYYMNVVRINVCPVYKAMKLDSEIRNGRFDDGGDGHHGVDDGDPLVGGDL